VEKADSAVICYNLAFNLDNDNIALLRKVGLAYSSAGKHDKAVETIQKAIKKDPKDVYNLLALGKVYIKADSIDKAQITITRAREMNKKIPDALCHSRRSLLRSKSVRIGKSNYEEALSINEKLSDVRTTLLYATADWPYKSRMETKIWQINIRYVSCRMEQIGKDGSKKCACFLEQGKLFFFSNRKKEAAASLNKYVELRPNGSLGRWYLAQSFYDLNDYDKAIPHLDIVAKKSIQ